MEVGVNMVKPNGIIIVRGGGDIATGVIQKFHRCGFKLLVLETGSPTAIRRSVALCEAAYTGCATVEDLHCVKITDIAKLNVCYDKGNIPLFVDPGGECIKQLKPMAVIDAIITKRNIGTHVGMALITIGLGPGFIAGTDVSAVIETKRGHDLGRLILTGNALPNTGIPGEVVGKSKERVIHAPVSGEVKHIHKIGDVVNTDEVIFEVGNNPVIAPFKGLLRGLIREGLHVPAGMKIADIDPRLDVDFHTISDKARCLGGAALEAYFYLRYTYRKNNYLSV